MMTPSLLVILALQIGQAPPAPAPGGTATATAQEPAPLTDLQIDALVRQLGDDDFHKREAAQTQLNGMSDSQIAVALTRIAADYRDTHDAEIRMRLRRFGDHCFEQLVLPRYRLMQSPGYLGITYATTHVGPDSAAAIIVGSILQNGPADKAGMKEGDIITAIDDKPFASDDTTTAFAKAVKELKPGTGARFTVIRNDKTQTLTVQIGAMPDQFQNSQAAKIRKEQAEELRRHWFAEGLAKGVLYPKLPDPPAVNDDAPIVMPEDNW